MSLEAKIEGLQLVIEKLNINIERLITAQSAAPAASSAPAADAGEKKTRARAQKDEPKPEPTKPTITLDEVRTKLFAFRDAHDTLDAGKEAARKILREVAKAPKVDEIPAEAFEAVIKACDEGLAALAAGGAADDGDDI